MKLDAIKVVNDGTHGHIDTWKPKEGTCVAAFRTDSVDKDGRIYPREAMRDAMNRVELPIPVRLESGSEVGQVTGMTMTADGSVLFDMKMDTDAYPDVWRGISNGYITDLEAEISE